MKKWICTGSLFLLFLGAAVASSSCASPKPEGVTMKDAYYCGKSDGVHDSNPQITYWTDGASIRLRFNCDAVDKLLGIQK